MALGNENNQKKYYEPLVYSQFGVSNTEGVDPSALSFTFWNRMLKVAITPMKPTANPNDRNIWDRDNETCVWLTPTKAKMLADEIRYAMANPDSCNNAGVPTGKDGLISFSNGKELGATSPCLIIRKINQDDGTVNSVYAYQFKTEYRNYRSVRNYDPNHPADFESYCYANTEIEGFLAVLDQYYLTSTGAVGYAVIDAARYDIQKNNTKMELIMEKLGIERPDYSRGGNRGGSSGGSFFSSNNGKQDNSMQHTTMDGLVDGME